jgi:energy-coupling factor transporter transmembrane protein EcfT
MKSWHKPRPVRWTWRDWLALAALLFAFIIAPAIMSGIVGE